MTEQTAKRSILPVILAGGGGTRLWPQSRGAYPKQFLDLTDDNSLLQNTLARLPQVFQGECADPLLVCNEEHRFLVAEQLRQSGFSASSIMLEPVGRNTAPALSAAALHACALADDPMLIMMPSDHLVADLAAFAAAVQRAVEWAERGAVVTLGISPTRAETGYGYIEQGAVEDQHSPRLCALASFREKPDAQTAAAYLSSGNYLWNAGIFVMRASTWVRHAQTYSPEILAAVSAAVSQGSDDGDFFRLDKDAFTASPSDSVDYAVMEPLSATDGAAYVVALDAGWSDVGSWASLWDVSAKDEQGNVQRGDVCAIDSSNNLVFSEHRLVATLGCENLAIIETADAVLVADKRKTESVKSVVDWLASQEREERLTHRRVFRPWGSYESVDQGPRFQVKRIIVNPGAALSLQLHHHRAEHWIVVAGTARVTCDDKTFLLAENESTYIPIGTTHRLENPGTLPLELIEVQSGSYLGEDDIVRFEDRYRRV